MVSKGSNNGAGTTVGKLLQEGLIVEARAPEELRLFGVQHDSRLVSPGDIFVAVQGMQEDGQRFARSAVEKGAVAVATERWIADEYPQVRVKNARASLGELGEYLCGSPTKLLKVAGVTGTNGKSTCVALLKTLLEGLQFDAFSLGTLGLQGFQTESMVPEHTTPEGDDLARLAQEALLAGKTHMAMEVSSHALALHRVDGVHFDVVAFTNLTQDHLDYHGDIESYFEAKSRLFLDFPEARRVINVEDEYGARLARRLISEGLDVLRVSTSADDESDLCLRSQPKQEEETLFRISGPVIAQSSGSESTMDVVSSYPLPGKHNLENLAVVLGMVVSMGLDPCRALASGFAGLEIPGRLQRIEVSDCSFSAFVDYAHTPVALEAALRALQKQNQGRLILVFGAGGDRDRSKRRLMGRVAAEHATLCIVTNDNPRTEDPSAIVAEIAAGLEERSFRRGALDGPGEYMVLPDRREAIGQAVSVAEPEDIILVAGKGHETYQIIGDARLPFDDVAVLREAMVGGGMQ